MKILLLGAGQMAAAYAKVLSNLKADFVVVGRSTKSSEIFKNSTGIEAVTGGYEKFLEAGNPLPSKAIIAIDDELLHKAIIDLSNAGVKEILTEKPAGLFIDYIAAIKRAAEKNDIKVYVAYNRRFYASVLKALELIKEDGGVKSFHFEFTEWAHKIEILDKPKIVLNRWLIANSSHVIDLAFFLGGKPRQINSYVSGKLSWHPDGCIFTGCGVAENSALFSYNANWASPGRWGVEIMTNNYRLILRPLEKLQIMKKGSVNIEEVEIDYSLDTEFKPGLYLQTKNFIKQSEKLLPIEEHLKIFQFYEKILNPATDL